MRATRTLRNTLTLFTLSCLGVFAMAADPTTQPASPIAEGATLQKVATGFAFTEGPACDASGAVYFTDQPNDAIYRVVDGEKPKIFLQPAGRSNGMCFDSAGNLISCADDLNQLWSITPDGKHTVLIENFQSKLLNGPNDVWLQPTPDGSPEPIYITDPLYKRDYWKNRPGKSEQPGEYVYRLSPDRKTLTPVVTDLRKPNGIIGTPDGKTLYISDIGANKTYRYTIAPDGSLTDKTLFCEMGSDGMTIDSEGNLFLTNHGVTIFSPTGQKITHIPIDENWTGNICFGGKDRRTLYITASTSLYTLQMRTHGVGSQ